MVRRLSLGQAGIKPQISVSALLNLLPLAGAVVAAVAATVAKAMAVAMAVAGAAVLPLACGRCNGPTNRNKSHATWPICGVHKSVNNLPWPRREKQEKKEKLNPGRGEGPALCRPRCVDR